MLQSLHAHTQMTSKEVFELNDIFWLSFGYSFKYNMSAADMEVGSILKMLYHSTQWKGEAVYA